MKHAHTHTDLSHRRRRRRRRRCRAPRSYSYLERRTSEREWSVAAARIATRIAVVGGAQVAARAARSQAARRLATRRRIADPRSRRHLQPPGRRHVGPPPSSTATLELSKLIEFALGSCPTPVFNDHAPPSFNTYHYSNTVLPSSLSCCVIAFSTCTGKHKNYTGFVGILVTVQLLMNSSLLAISNPCYQ